MVAGPVGPQGLVPVVDLLLDLADPWGYVLVFLLGLAEGAALIGLFLPGETAMILGGVLVSQGRAALGGMLLSGCAGSALGDSIGYWLGHRFGGALRRSRLGRRIGHGRWDRALRFLHERGPSAVFFGRFLGFLRTLVPPLAGSSQMPYRRFAAFNVPAATLWAAIFILMGVAAGTGWRIVSAWAGRASLVVLILLALGVSLFLIARWLRRRVEILRVRSERWLRHPVAERLRDRYRPVLDFTRRRFEPGARFGLFLTLGVGAAVASSIALVAVIDSLIEGGDAVHVDAAVMDFFQQHRDPQLEAVMRAVARSGVVLGGFMVLVVLGAAVLSRQWGWLLFGAALIGGALLLDDVVRQLLDLFGIRPGPDRADIAESFPSSRLTAGGIAVGGTAYVLARWRSWSSAVVVGAAMLFVLFTIAVALMYLGTQTPSSLAAGFFVGFLWAAISATSSNQLWHLRQSRTSPEGAA